MRPDRPVDRRHASLIGVRRAIALAALFAFGNAHAGDPCAGGIGQALSVTNNGFADFVIDGIGDPGLVVVRGCTYTFSINTPGHPFFLKTVQGAGVANQYNSGVTGNGSQTGDLVWTVSQSAPDTLYYNCQFHPPMTNVIMVIDGPPPDFVFAGDFEDTSGR